MLQITLDTLAKLEEHGHGIGYNPGSSGEYRLKRILPSIRYFRRNRMRRIFSASVVSLLFGLTPGTGTAAPIVQGSVVTANPAIAFVDGWWEQEHREQDARERYWRLPPKQLQRYHRLQADSDRRDQQRRRIDDENSRAHQEQHRLLGFDR
jgi:hypothetical protein